MGAVVRRHGRGLTAVAAALGLTAGLAACGHPGDSDGVTLRLVAADYGDSPANASQKYWTTLADRFEASHPGIRIKVAVYSWNDVDRRVKDMVARGDAPDIAQIGAYADYAAQDRLYSADDVLSIPTEANFLPALRTAGEVSRIQYGLPFVASTRLLFYNRTLFAKAGIGGPPTTWEELRDDAALLKAHGVKVPFALPLGPEEAQAETMMWLLSGGDGYVNDIGSYTLDSKQNVRTFTWLKDNLVGPGLTGPTPPARLDRAEAFAEFADGDVGMLNGHPTLMKTADDQGVKFGMVPLPGPDGRAKAAMGVADWMMAFKQGGHKAEIRTFLDYVYNDTNMLSFCREYDLLPVTTSASQAMSGAHSAGRLGPFLDELPSAELYPVAKTSWAAVSADIKKTIGSAVAPGADPASVLGALERSAQATDNAD
ncbi:solute-binding protein [Streptomyces sulfonofaciens]|uniref:Solute-binding protein n=1 Tax=Streptomyces sulfonofaciens TaxID=68272 RepID=A0A919L6M8_9ACTN|nr:extracellular solute-binding protein [Streptomyces sulfonofaciens]GHH85888.1 solute-binding protein [Streptomyces sulfonofaciens]